MGNTNGVMRPNESHYGNALFHALDVSANGYLTLKDLMDSLPPGLMLPRSLPALYFFDVEKDGRLTEEEFTCLVQYCQVEKRKVEQALIHDKNFRDLILRASKAGVKDCSVHNRSSYRRLSSYSKVRSVFCSRRDNTDDASTAINDSDNNLQLENDYPSSEHPTTTPEPSTITNTNSSHHTLQSSQPSSLPPSSSSSSTSSDSDDTQQISQIEQTTQNFSDINHDNVTEPNSSMSSVPTSSTNQCVAMYSAEREVDTINSGEDHDSSDETDRNTTDSDLLQPQNRTAIDVAVVENIINASIHKLADLLHTEGSRENFMEWLWALADFNSSGVVTLEELRVFLNALSEDGIDLEELAFHKEGGEPLEVCIINEFDTTHAGLLSRDEFMVLADLVTREYEFWENRHLERIGDYELGRTIGRGSSGVVRLAFHVENRQKFAIKIIKKGKCSDLSRLDREIQSLMAAEHEHIVKLEEVLDSDNNIFIVMELCGGGSMVDIVRLYPEERMPEETARFFMRQVFEALEYCHSNGICHRDVRLDNFMLDNTGNVKITDFGHSGMYTPGWDIFSTALVGSVYNLSPEQIRGQVYSGEKIDVWSAGVAIYCLLIGQPPFYDPDVNLLLQRITECSYNIPDFISSKGKDLIKCMIRANGEERIPIHQMLHHPWFYDGPEYGPSMNAVVFPVDIFYTKRPDIAEMILAMTIYQHNLHFHLADTQNPMSSAVELRGQDWTLKCLDPRNDIKFTVSLFTKPPHPATTKKQKSGLTTCASTLSLLPASIATESSTTTTSTIATTTTTATTTKYDSIQNKTDDVRNISDRVEGRVTPRHIYNNETGNLQNNCSKSIKDSFEFGKSSIDEEHVENKDDNNVSNARPPLQRKSFKVTPMDVAAHIRASGATPRLPMDPFDSEPSENRNATGWYSFQDEWLRKHDDDDDDDDDDNGNINNDVIENNCSDDEEDDYNDNGDEHSNDDDDTVKQRKKKHERKKERRRRRRRSHSRSHSLDDDSIGICRINRSATVDAFPYQKVIPQRKMPESVRKLDFGKPDGTMMEKKENGMDNGNDDDVTDRGSYGGEVYSESAPITPTMDRHDNSTGFVNNNNNNNNNNVNEEGMLTPNNGRTRDEEIELKIVRHPSKTVSPQSPQVGRCVTAGSNSSTSNGGLWGGMTLKIDNNGCSNNELDEDGKTNDNHTNNNNNNNNNEIKENNQPFIEVRLQDGEAGLFLKICRKLKTICTTKLGEVAQRRKHMKIGERRSLTTLRRTASAKSMDSECDVTATT